MSAVSGIITQDQIQDLWGCGYTIVARSRHPDPFFVSPEMVPQGRSYQWWHLVHDQFHFKRAGGDSNGWSPVPASRHDGYFMPFGHTGDIEVSGLGLFEKSKVEVDSERAQQIAAAHRMVTDWKDRVGAEFSGEVKFGDETLTVGDQEKAQSFASPETKTIETTVAIPRDMMPHMVAIFVERERLAKEVVQPDRSLKPGPVADKFYAAIDADKAAPWWPTLNAVLLPIAIDRVRKSLKEAVSQVTDEEIAFHEGYDPTDPKEKP